MKNKYQEALMKLVSHNYSTSSEKNGYINTLQELVNKETLMKVNQDDYELVDCNDCDYFPVSVHLYKCPNPKCTLHKRYVINLEESRCPKCNQRLDWR